MLGKRWSTAYDAVYAETNPANHCVLSPRTLLVGVPLECRCPPAYHKCTCACSSVHQLYTRQRLCRQLRIHTESLVALGRIVKYYARTNSSISLVAPSQVVIIAFYSKWCSQNPNGQHPLRWLFRATTNTS